MISSHYRCTRMNPTELLGFLTRTVFRCIFPLVDCVVWRVRSRLCGFLPGRAIARFRTRQCFGARDGAVDGEVGEMRGGSEGALRTGRSGWMYPVGGTARLVATGDAMSMASG